jgi:hypothetical protein
MFGMSGKRDNVLNQADGFTVEGVFTVDPFTVVAHRSLCQSFTIFFFVVESP